MKKWSPVQTILGGQGRDIRWIRCPAVSLVAACAPLVLVLTLLASPVSAATITEFALPTSVNCLNFTGPCSFPQGITAGPDGNVWFAEAGVGKIGRITPTGVITEFPTTTSMNCLNLLEPCSAPEGITLGPDGNLWFAEFNFNMIGRITPAGVITEFPLSPDYLSCSVAPYAPCSILCFNGAVQCSQPTFITTGPDGNLWVAQNNAD